MKGTHIYKFYFLAAYIFSDGGVVDTFPYLCSESGSEIGNDFVVYYPSALTVGSGLIVTGTHVQSALFEGFYLIMYFFTYSIRFIKAVEHKK